MCRRSDESPGLRSRTTLQSLTITCVYDGLVGPQGPLTCLFRASNDLKGDFKKEVWIRCGL